MHIQRELIHHIAPRTIWRSVIDRSIMIRYNNSEAYRPWAICLLGWNNSWYLPQTGHYLYNICWTTKWYKCNPLHLEHACALHHVVSDRLVMHTSRSHTLNLAPETKFRSRFSTWPVVVASVWDYQWVHLDILQVATLRFCGIISD